MITSLNIIYFSPTGTTERIVKSIADGIKAENINISNLTHKSVGNVKINDGLTIICIPVYAGRVPETFIKRFEAVTADNIPAVIVAVYGNRHYDDALLEMKNLCSEKGFSIIGAAAFIGEHSYSNSDKPIAEGRPDRGDIETAADFGKTIAQKYEKQNYSTPQIPGNYPYRDGISSSDIVPVTDDEKCVMCGKCVESCPTGIITKSEKIITASLNCIMCRACIKKCPESARRFIHPKIEETRTRLFNNCSIPKNPEIFL